MAANDGTITFRVTRQNQTIELNTAIPANADVSLKSVHVNRVPLPETSVERSLYCGDLTMQALGGQVDPLSSVRVNFDSDMFGTAKMIHENSHPEGFSVPLNDGASTTFTPDGFDLLRATEQETKFFQVKTSYLTGTGGLTNGVITQMKHQLGAGNPPAVGLAQWQQNLINFYMGGGLFFADASAAGVIPLTQETGDDSAIDCMAAAYGMIYSIEFTFAYATSRTLN